MSTEFASGQNVELAVWEKPALRAHGTIEEMTKGNATGNFLDAAFPEGTPFSELTFS